MDIPRKKEGLPNQSPTSPHNDPVRSLSGPEALKEEQHNLHLVGTETRSFDMYIQGQRYVGRIHTNSFRKSKWQNLN